MYCPNSWARYLNRIIQGQTSYHCDLPFLIFKIMTDCYSYLVTKYSATARATNQIANVIIKRRLSLRLGRISTGLATFCAGVRTGLQQPSFSLADFANRFFIILSFDTSDLSSLKSPQLYHSGTTIAYSGISFSSLRT